MYSYSMALADKYIKQVERARISKLGKEAFWIPKRHGESNYQRGLRVIEIKTAQLKKKIDDEVKGVIKEKSWFEKFIDSITGK